MLGVKIQSTYTIRDREPCSPVFYVGNRHTQAWMNGTFNSKYATARKARAKARNAKRRASR